MNNWNLRTEILKISHQWYQVVIFCVVGGLGGLGLGKVWPSPYRVSTDIYVGLNAYRSPYDNYIANVSQQEFRMVDDYKNWQMEQLNALILSDAFLEDTISKLATNTPEWIGSDTQDLRPMLAVMWRNPGDWHLSVETNNQINYSQSFLHHLLKLVHLF